MFQKYFWVRNPVVVTLSLYFPPEFFISFSFGLSENIFSLVIQWIAEIDHAYTHELSFNHPLGFIRTSKSFLMLPTCYIITSLDLNSINPFLYEAPLQIRNEYEFCVVYSEK